MNKEKLMSYSDNPDGIGKEKLDPKAQIAKSLITDMDRHLSGKRAPRGRTVKLLARQYGAGTIGVSRWGKGARNPAERS